MRSWDGPRRERGEGVNPPPGATRSEASMARTGG